MRREQRHARGEPRKVHVQELQQAVLAGGTPRRKYKFLRH